MTTRTAQRGRPAAALDRLGVVVPNAEPKLDSRYELRMEADLKAWVKANGGDKLVRALLRDARTRHEA